MLANILTAHNSFVLVLAELGFLGSFFVGLFYYLIGVDLAMLDRTASQIINGHGKLSEIPPLWDGKPGERIIQIITEKCGN